MVTFNGTGGSTELKIVNQSAGTVGTRYLIKTRSGTDVKVLSGDVCLFWNDGTDWCLIAGGRPLSQRVTGGIGFSGAWSDGFGNAVSYSKDEFGVVRLSGVADNASYTTTTNDLMFTLPVGFRPEVIETIPVIDYVGLAVALLSVLPNGQVRFTETGVTAGHVTPALTAMQFLAYY
jgi:hypothetical protein